MIAVGRANPRPLDEVLNTVTILVLQRAVVYPSLGAGDGLSKECVAFLLGQH